MTESNEKNLTNRYDFLTSGGGKGSYTSDPLTRQTINTKHYKQLTYYEIDSIVNENAIIENIVKMPAEDITRNGFEIILDNQKLKTQIEEKLKELDFLGTLKKALVYKRKYGDGFISIGTTETQEFELSEEIDPKNLISVDYIHPFSPKYLSTVKLNENVFDINYGNPEVYKVKANTSEINVDPSRIIRLSEEIPEGEIYGRSILEPLTDIIKIFDTAIWSTGQILFDYTFKVMKTKEAETMTKQELQEARVLMDYMFRTEAMAIITPDEAIERHTTPLGGISELINFVWETLAGSAKMPKNVILGQQQGTITGGQYDILNYFNRIEAIQENDIKPIIQEFIKLLLSTSEFGNKDDIDFDIEFNPLWSLDANEEADLELKKAQKDQIHLQWGIVTPQELRERRYDDLEPMEIEIPELPEGNINEGNEEEEIE